MLMSTTAHLYALAPSIMFERDVGALYRDRSPRSANAELLPERRGYAFVKMVAENMMSSGKEIGHLNVQLWLGYQAWFGDTITAWGRAKVGRASRRTLHCLRGEGITNFCPSPRRCWRLGISAS